MSMTFLQLAQRLKQECGASGVSGTAPAATTGQVGEMKRLVDWINSAWLDIQNLHQNWRWMRRECTVNTVAGTGSYAPTAFTDVTDAAAISAFSHWRTEPNIWTLYKQATGQSDEGDLWMIDFDTWRFLYDRGANASTQARPFHIAVAPDQKIKLGAKPDAVYVIRGWYQQCATELSGDGDIPELPAQYHMAIVWKALMKYGEFESAPEAFTAGNNNYGQLLSQLEIDQLPRIAVGRPMVG